MLALAFSSGIPSNSPAGTRAFRREIASASFWRSTSLPSGTRSMVQLPIHIRNARGGRTRVASLAFQALNNKQLEGPNGLLNAALVSAWVKATKKKANHSKREGKTYMAQPTEAAAFEMHSPTQPVTELAAIARETSRDKVTMKLSLSMIVAEGREVIGLACLKIEGQDIGGLYPLASNRY